MNSRYFVQLALQNISKHRQTYFPYMIAVSCFVSMLYLLLFLRDNVVATEEINNTVFNYFISLAVYVFGFFVVVFLIYSNSFLIQPRTKEFGLFYLFGLSQRHLVIIMVYEVVFSYVISILVGLLSGFMLSRLMSMFLSALIKSPLSIQNVIDVYSIYVTTGLFIAVMCVVLLINVMQIVNAKPLSLAQSTEYTSRSSWRQYLLLLLGVLSIGYGYYTILSVDSSQEAFAMIAGVSLTIIVGTFCLFKSLSELILRIFTQRPSIYYRTDNFIIINGLLNRIRFNAVGLASMSVFALIILIIVSMSVVIYIGADESVENMYAADVIVTIQERNIQSKELLHQRINDVVTAHDISNTIINSYTFLSISAVQSGMTFTYEDKNRTFVGDVRSHFIVMFTAKEYARVYGETLALAANEVAVYSSHLPLPDKFTLQGNAYRVVTRLPPLSIANYDLEQLVNAHFVVVHDESILATHERNKYLQNKLHPSPIRYRLGIDLSGTTEQKLAAYESIKQMLTNNDVVSQQEFHPNDYVEIVDIQSRQAEKIVFDAVYGTFLFLGLFLGLLFMLSTALLIYYKQLSEGYEDKARYEILQRIGMTLDEVRTIVDKQIVVLFFIPLFVASVNFLISLHLIEHLLELFRIESLQLLIIAALVTLLVFSLLYLIIYRVSARVYYNIVR